MTLTIDIDRKTIVTYGDEISDEIIEKYNLSEFDILYNSSYKGKDDEDIFVKQVDWNESKSVFSKHVEKLEF